MKKLLTIVIPCKNEGEQLINTLNSIKVDCDIIIADSSDDDTLKNIPKKDNITVVKGGYPAIARNNGAKLVNTPYVLFLDADMDISKINLTKILNDVIKNGYYLVTTRITTRSVYSIVYNMFFVIQCLISKSTPFAVGGFMLFNTDVFNILDGFNINDKFAEDYHLSMKVSPKRFKIYTQAAYTSDRRLKNKGLLYMTKLMVKCWFNRYNNEFYTKDYNYWK